MGHPGSLHTAGRSVNWTNLSDKTLTVSGTLKINSPNDPQLQLLSKYPTESLTRTRRHIQELSYGTGDDPSPIKSRTEEPTIHTLELLHKQRKHIIKNTDEPSKIQGRAKEHRRECIWVRFYLHRIRSSKMKLFSDT